MEPTAAPGLDDTLAEVHDVLGRIVLYWDFDDAGRGFRRAIELSPKHVAPHYMYGFYLLLVKGKGDEAIDEARRAVAIDPLDSHATGMLGIILRIEGRSREAIRLLESAIEREPTYFLLQRCLGLAYAAESDYPQAIAAFEQAALLSRRDIVVLMEFAWVQVQSGNTAEAEAILEELLARSAQEYVSPCCMAFVQGVLGRNDEAFALFERAYDVGDPPLVATRVWQRIYGDPLYKDPRYDALLRRIGWD